MYTQEEYEQLKHNYLDSWTDEQLQTRKEQVVYIIGHVPEYLPEAVQAKHERRNGVTHRRNPEYSLLNCQYHDLDEEQDVRAYYVEHPSPTRAEFKEIQQRINA